jgi:hypothetical protein
MPLSPDDDPGFEILYDPTLPVTSHDTGIDDQLAGHLFGGF